MLFAVSTGMRQGEILNLRWEQVDHCRRVIHISSSGMFNTKSGRSRVIPMNDTLHSMLTTLSLRPHGQFVFTAKGQPILPNHLQHKFKKAVRMAGLDDRLHWHSLRHTHASWLVQCGVSLYEVQRLLGHSSPRVTEVYAHLQPDQLYGTVNRIQIALN